jgi:penicillin-binding protein 1A
MVGRLLIGLMVLVSALVGAAAGLLLVYSTDLPQVGQLEHYRPSAITELYDDQDRTAGWSRHTTTIPRSCARH